MCGCFNLTVSIFQQKSLKFVTQVSSSVVGVAQDGKLITSTRIFSFLVKKVPLTLKTFLIFPSTGKLSLNLTPIMNEFVPS